MRRAVLTLAVISFWWLAVSAEAQEFTACWVDVEVVPGVGVERTITRCRISGGGVVDYASDDSVPSRLYPNVGIDLTGDCWYLTSAPTDWLIRRRVGDGEAILVLVIGGQAVIPTDPMPRCTSEPGVLVDPSTEAWEYVTAFVHPPPTPDVNPAPGDGVTGLETFVGVLIPDVHETQLSSVTGVTLDIYIEVSGVVVDWGDARVDTFPADVTALAGYPDGGARHVYEVKDDSGYNLDISYAWTARWRVAGEDWVFLDVPDTTTSIVYPVAEIVSVITD